MNGKALAMHSKSDGINARSSPRSTCTQLVSFQWPVLNREGSLFGVLLSSLCTLSLQKFFLQVDIYNYDEVS